MRLARADQPADGLSDADRAPGAETSASRSVSAAALGCVMVLAGVALWATIGVTIRWVTADAGAVAFWRGVGGGSMALLVLLARRRLSPRAGLRAVGRAGLLVAACSAAGGVLFIIALRLSSVADVLTIYGCLPFVTAALAWFLWREIGGPSTLLAAGVALTGVIITAGGGITFGAGPGHLLAVGMTLAYAGQILLLRRYPTIPVLPVVALASFGCAALALIAARPGAAPNQEIVVLLASGALQGVAGDWLFMRGAQMLSPASTALLGTLETPLGAIAAWLALGEQPALATVAGAALIVSAAAGHGLATARGDDARNVSVATFPGRGQGLRTRRALRAGETAVALAGRRMDRPDRLTIQLADGVHLHPGTALWGFSNHSCDPNAAVDVRRLRLVALRPIDAGEEVTWNYLTTEWSMASPFACGCGAACCEGQIRGLRFARQATVRRLAPNLSPGLAARLASVCVDAEDGEQAPGE